MSAEKNRESLKIQCNISFVGEADLSIAKICKNGGFQNRLHIGGHLTRMHAVSSNGEDEFGVSRASR